MACFSSSFKPVESQVPAWTKKDTVLPESIQEKGPKVVDNSAIKAPDQTKEKFKQYAKVVWTIGPPICEEDTWDQQPKYLKDTGKHFTEVCAMCKKDIIPSKNVYMYGYLQAFCSHECREDKVAFDRVFGPPSSQGEGANNKSIVNLVQPVGDGTEAPTIKRSKRLHTMAE